MIVSLVRAAEASSTLVTALERIAGDIEERRDSRAQLLKALTYPTIVTVLGSLAVGFLMVFVVPVFQETYEKGGMTLPTITVVLIALSEIVGKTWWIVIGLSVLGALLYRRFRSDERVQAVRDRMLLRLPVFGPVIRTVLIGRFIQAFGSLLDAGVSIKESLALTEQVVQHSEFRKMVRELQFAIARGEGIGRKLGEYESIFPPLLTQMMALGEKSGELGKMVVQIGVYVAKDLKRRTQQMSTLIEPIVTVGMAFAIGAVALAIYLPIFDMFKEVGK
jgi:type II secretory pathway component PulF